MADDKWISGLSGDMPVGDAARRALIVRLGVVVERLPAALDRADEDVEHVHQLRVGTRRATAALRVFEGRLPAKLHRKTRRTLRSVRRGAGAARDWDVFLGMLNARTARVDAKCRPGFDVLLGYGHGQRVFAQSHLRQEADGQLERLGGLVTEIDEALRESDPAPTLRELAVPLLTRLVGEFEEAARGDLGDAAALHQLRILGKQLRYAMELFESCFDPAFRDDIYPCVVATQDILGLANDSQVALGHLEELRVRLERSQPRQWPRLQPAFARLEQFHRRRQAEQRRALARWWADWQSSGHAAQLAGLLRASRRVGNEE